MVGTFCTKRKGRKGLKGQITQVNKGRVQVICELLTQVREDRVKDIGKFNPGQERQGTGEGCSPGSTRQGIKLQLQKPVFKTGRY